MRDYVPCIILIKDSQYCRRRRCLRHLGPALNVPWPQHRAANTQPHLKDLRMTLFILGLLVGVFFGLMCSGFVQGCRLENDQEMAHLDVEERRYAR